MTTGPVHKLTFLWEIKATNGVEYLSTGSYHHLGPSSMARRVEREVTGDTPEQALGKFRDWYTTERNKALVVYEEELEHKGNTGNDPDQQETLEVRFNSYWPKTLLVQSIQQKGVIIT
jgi:hypothetical protein